MSVNYEFNQVVKEILFKKEKCKRENLKPSLIAIDQKTFHILLGGLNPTAPILRTDSSPYILFGIPLAIFINSDEKIIEVGGKCKYEN